jgi:hypothetical protein
MGGIFSFGSNTPAPTEAPSDEERIKQLMQKKFNAEMDKYIGNNDRRFQVLQGQLSRAERTDSQLEFASAEKGEKDYVFVACLIVVAVVLGLSRRQFW